MPESQTLLFLALIIVAVSVVSWVAFVRRNSQAQSRNAERLRRLVAQRDDYAIRIGVPLASPARWMPVTDSSSTSLTLDDGSVVSYSNVRAFVVTYPNGQLVDCESCGLPLPAGITGLWPSSDPDRDLLQLTDLESGKQFIQVTYGPCETNPNDPDQYSTTLKNISQEPVRVDRFAGYTKTSHGWQLSTVTRKFYTAEEFQEWYGLGKAQWIQPGESASDPNNYGGRPLLWAYYCESASGVQFVAGEILA